MSSRAGGCPCAEIAQRRRGVARFGRRHGKAPGARTRLRDRNPGHQGIARQGLGQYLLKAPFTVAGAVAKAKALKRAATHPRRWSASAATRPGRAGWRPSAGPTAAGARTEQHARPDQPSAGAHRARRPDRFSRQLRSVANTTVGNPVRAEIMRAAGAGATRLRKPWRLDPACW